MSHINKNIPITTLKILKQFMESVKSPLYHISNSDEYLLQIDDNDTTSGFFFQIQKFNPTQGLLLAYKPQDENSSAMTSFWIKPNEIRSSFNTWHNCLVALDELGDLFFDPFLRNLEQEFFSGFDLDEQNKNEPLTLPEIYYLEENLSKIESGLPSYIDQIDQNQLAEIIGETQTLKRNLAKQTKEWVAKRLSSILAKITKEGPDILKGIFKEISKELITQGVKYLIENGNKLS